jgi:hypothetical protein
MRKDLFERFIKKYHLHGLNNAAIWVKSSGTLRVQVMSRDKALIAKVTLKHFDGMDNAEMGVPNAERLLALLKAITSEHVSVDVLKHPSGAVAALTFSSASTEIQCVTSSLRSFDPIPNITNHPAYNAAVKLDTEFIDWLLKAYAAMQDSRALLTVAMSKQTGKLEVALGHCDRLSFRPNTVEGVNAVEAPISFKAIHLGKVIKANPEFKDPILNVSDAGLAMIAFSEDDLDSEYHLVPMVTAK